MVAVSREKYSFIVETLDPRHQAQQRQNLRLYAQSQVESLGDVVDGQRNTRPCPQHHHGGLEPSGIVAAVVDDDLGKQLAYA
jgi:hypothetical protein